MLSYLSSDRSEMDRILLRTTILGPAVLVLVLEVAFSARMATWILLVRLAVRYSKDPPHTLHVAGRVRDMVR